jgi:hypothetical protein
LHDIALQVKFVMDHKTTLADLLALNLHEYEEEVKNIVDQGIKEMSMEKVLKELNGTWSGMEFEKEIHPHTNCTVIRASEELIETLEENQVHRRKKSNYSELFFNKDYCLLGCCTLKSGRRFPAFQRAIFHSLL